MLVATSYRSCLSVALVLGPLALLLASCTAGTERVSAPSAQTAPRGGRADGLLPVDCLLPGQIRRLGGQITYVTARRAVKTSASDCEIRGGEYVSFDRANYATALKVWLPLAEGGDPAAQTYVGEIFEKGLGVPPDHQAAATWYRRAADRGYSRAAINLGQLYEQGLGVPKDTGQALGWYRKAAGLPDLAFGVVPAASAAEIERLRAEVGRLKGELSAKQAELDRTQRDLDGLRKSVEQRRGESDTERGTLARLRQELDAARRSEQAATGRLRDLEKAVPTREAQLAARDQEVAGLRAALTRAEAASTAKKTELEQLQQRIGAESGAQRAALEQQQRDAVAELARAQRELEGLKKNVAERARETEAERGQVARMRQDLETSRRSEQAATARQRELEKSVAEGETRLAAKDRELADLRVRLARSEKDQGTLRAELGRLWQQTTAASTGTRALTEGAPPQVGLPKPKAMAFGTYHALVIGNNNYRQLRKLKTAVNDAREIARILESNYGFRVTLLLDADRYQTLSALNDLRERLTDKDNLLIYYAGHGELDAKNQRGHWLPVDAEPGSSANWISNVAVTDILNSMSVQQLLVVADSCYSGTLTRSSLGRLEAGMSEAERLKVIQLMARKRSRMVMTSGGVEPVLDSSGGLHSAFAQSFIELLRTNVGVLPGQEMFGLLQVRVAATAQRSDVQQVPEYAPIKFAGHEAGDFFFVRSSN
jgi:predicted  nucleic acid-binding Zn-ribbon protein